MSTTELYNTFMDRRRILLPEIFNRTEGRVIAGPFQGMKISERVCWGDGDTAGKLLGLYENELNAIIETEIANHHDIIINYGCAEGYYGVGLAVRSPSSQVYIVDAAPQAIETAQYNASLNNVQVKELTVRTHDDLENLLVTAVNPLIVMDCEGAESIILDPSKVPSLKNAVIIVETHDCIRQGITDQLVERFDASHKIELIIQGSKNLYIDPIHDLSDIDKAILANENRPSTMGWLYMVPWGDNSESV